MDIRVDNDTNSQLPFFLVEDLDLEKSLNSNMHNRRQFPPMIHGNIIARYVMMVFRNRHKRAKLQNFKFSPFPLELLPPEIIYQIFENAHPIGLYNLARTSHAIRTMLLCPYGKGVWKTALALWLPFVPLNPPGMLEHEWIILLFGPDICDVCGRNMTTLHYIFHQRLCKVCESDQYVGGAHCVLGKTDLAQIVQTLLLRSKSYESHSYSKYRSSDVAYLASRVEEFQKAINTEQPGATTLYNEFLASERTRVSSAEKYTAMMTRWSRKIHDQLSQQHVALWKKTAEMCSKKLAQLGYDKRDLKAADNAFKKLINDSHILRFSSRTGWRTIRPKLEIIVQKEATTRIQEERRAIIRDLYVGYRNQKRMPTKRWMQAVPLSAIFQFNFFDQYIHSSDSKVVKPRSMVAKEAFNDVFKCWRKRRQRELAILIDSGHTDLSGTDVVKVLELATSVFICEANLCITLLGRFSNTIFDAGVDYHTFKHPPARFSRVGHDAAGSIVRLLQRDPETTKTIELDELDARFFCESCPHTKDGKMQGRKAFTWRECVIHAIEMEASQIESHGLSNWALLTPEATVSVRVHELPIHSPDSLSWSCNHCTVHYSIFTKRKVAMEHVRNSHLIPHPVPGKDFVFMPNLWAPDTKRKPLLLARDNEYLCKHCLPSKKRLRRLQDQCLHLSDKHGVRQPVENKDWVHIKMVERTWPRKTSGWY